MDRFTKFATNGEAYIEANAITSSGSGYVGAAVDRLATFETICNDLAVQQDELALQLEKLRSEGKKDSVKFRELMMRKLTNSHVLSLFQAYGLR